MNILQALGINRVINAAGAETPLGGSVLPPEVVDAMREASFIFLDMHELLYKAGKRVAELLGVKAAFITSGAAAGLAISAAACIAGKDIAKIKKLPITDDMKNQIVVQRAHRTVFDNAYMMAGARLIEIGRPFIYDKREIEGAINDKTAAIAFTVTGRGVVSLEEYFDVAKRYGLPLIVDAAPVIPPLTYPRKLCKNADLVVVSGGKALRGPNDSGIICGEPDLIEACALNAHPNFAIGRPMKISKEQIVGLVAAVELYAKKDEDAEINKWFATLKKISEILDSAPNFEKKIVFPDEINRPVPRLHIRIGRNRVWEVIEKLKNGTPKIFTADYLTLDYYPDWLIIDPTTLLEGDDEIVANRLLELLKSL
jgi:L-seryl-tRNA(Ser) seleniumtransferase